MMTIEDELNALTNAHYVPMRPTEDLTIATKAPVISLEEGCDQALNLFMIFIIYLYVCDGKLKRHLFLLHIYIYIYQR